MDIIVPDLESAQESSPSICSRILHYCLHFTNGRSSSCTIFFFLAQESCICFHFSMGTSFCCMLFNLLNNSASASNLYGQIFLLHPLQSAQESCIIVSISRSVIISIASILSEQNLLIAFPSSCSRILDCFNFSMARSSYCILFNLLKNPALLFQFLYGQIFHIALTSICSIFILHALQSAQEPLHLLLIFYGQIFLLHPLQYAQESCIASRFRV